MSWTHLRCLAPVALCVALAPGLASAQAMTFAGIDTNGDEMLQFGELRTVFGPNAQLALETYDRDGDGLVSFREAKRAMLGPTAPEAEVARDEPGLTKPAAQMHEAQTQAANHEAVEVAEDKVN